MVTWTQCNVAVLITETKCIQSYESTPFGRLTIQLVDYHGKLNTLTYNYDVIAK